MEEDDEGKGEGEEDDEGEGEGKEEYRKLILVPTEKVDLREGGQLGKNKERRNG